MSSTSPTPSSTAAASSASESTATSTSNNSSTPPIFVGFIGVGVLTLCLIFLCVWRRYIGHSYPFTTVFDLNERRPQNDNDHAKGRPEMFDAWTGERASYDLKWEEYVPFSVTSLPDAESNLTSRKGKVGKHRARDKEREKQDLGSSGSGLQVAVLVAMPSPSHAQSHDGVGEAPRGSLRELAVGLIELPWIKEDRQSLKRNAS